MLSGGLGSSAYVQKKLEGFCNKHDHLKNTRVIVSRHPRMAVSMGLVFDAVSNRSLLAEVCCRNSFGLVFRMPNDNSLVSRWTAKVKGFKLWGLRRKQDPLTSGVNWFIKQVSLLHRISCLQHARLLIRFKDDKIANGDEKSYTYKACFKADGPRVCDIEIVASSNETQLSSEKGIPTTQSHPDTVYIKLTDLKITRKVVYYCTLTSSIPPHSPNLPPGGENRTSHLLFRSRRPLSRLR